MSRKRLTSEHPVSVKLAKVFKLMSKLGISVEITRYGELLISEKSFDRPASLLDNEDGSNVTELPPMFDYKLVIDDRKDRL